MLERTTFSERFANCVRRLLRNANFRKEVIGRLGEKIVQRVQKNLPLDEGDQEELSEIAEEVYCAKQVLSLGWDGDAPGMSGELYRVSGNKFILGTKGHDA